MNARFRLKDGWELRARTAPDALGRYGPALCEIILWEPETNDPDRLRTGMSYSGDDWKACFRQLRQEMAQGGVWLSAHLVPIEGGLERLLRERENERASFELPPRAPDSED